MIILSTLHSDSRPPMNPSPDPVNSPKHYTSHPSGVECIEITRHMTFNLGNVLKYCWRCGKKDPKKEIEDLKKARFYLDDEIKRLEKEASPSSPNEVLASPSWD